MGEILDGRYVLDELIGRGGTAQVYRGRDELLGRTVAVKVFDARLEGLNSQARQRFEIRVLARLAHPHLVGAYDAHLAAPSADGATEGTASSSALTYLVMEWVGGPTLAKRLRSGPLPAAEVASLGAELAEVLQLVHDHGLVHRDVKPANVLFTESGQVKLGDFGLARSLGAAHLTADAQVMGTAAYLSPEQAQARTVGPPTDIYALGLVLLEALTGRREFPGAAVPSALARLLRDPAVPAGLPAPWPALLAAMTAREPGDRPTGGQVAAVLGGGAPEAVLAAPISAAANPAGPTVVAPAPRPVRPAQGRDPDPSATTSSRSGPLSVFLTESRSHGGRRRRLAGLLAVAAVLAAAAVWAVAAAVGERSVPPPVAAPAAARSSASAPATTLPSPPTVGTGAATPAPVTRTAGTTAAGQTATVRTGGVPINRVAATAGAAVVAAPISTGSNPGPTTSTRTGPPTATTGTGGSASVGRASAAAPTGPATAGGSAKGQNQGKGKASAPGKGKGKPPKPGKG